MSYGESQLVAAMRCYACSVLGDRIDIEQTFGQNIYLSDAIINRGFDVNIKDIHGETALVILVSNKSKAAPDSFTKNEDIIELF